MNARILDIDIETAPAKVHAWGLFNQNIGLSQVLEDPRIMGFGAKWRHERRVQWYSEYHHDRPTMLSKAHDLLDEADVVVHYNGNTFDTPWIQGELAREGYDAPSPFKQIDLYRVAKRNMRFLSHKLQYVSGALLGDSKVQHSGHSMWVKCLEGTDEEKRKAWNEMRRYCIKDVRLLEPLSDKLRPYFPASVNFAIYSPGDEMACQKCASTNLERRGIAYTAQRAYPQYRCHDCGGWTRDSHSSWSIQSVGVTR
jgi:DNA polymerase elongation subunit (family B)